MPKVRVIPSNIPGIAVAASNYSHRLTQRQRLYAALIIADQLHSYHTGIPNNPWAQTQYTNIILSNSTYH